MNTFSIKEIHAYLARLISAWGYKFHLSVYTLCVVGGLLFMSWFSFPDQVPLSGDEFDYQSIAVNFIHGHGFPVSGAIEDSAVYNVFYYPGMLYGRPWSYYHQLGSASNFYRNPIYPLFVSAVYQTFGIRPDILHMIQFLLLILTGSLLPYLCYRIWGAKGILTGMLSYIAFIFFDHHYAFDVMCEALIIPYIIVFLIYYYVSDHSGRFSQALILGAILGLGLLLKNYFFPLVLILSACSFYQSFISKTLPSKNALALFAGILLTILPWTIYANYTYSKADPGYSFIMITRQGSDVLLASNNEYATDGMWHPEWTDEPDSYYNLLSIKDKTALGKVFSFYTHHIRMAPSIFSAKVMMGLFATIPQICLYLSQFAFVIVYKTKRKILLMVPVLCLLGAIIFPSTARSVLSHASHLIYSTPTLRYLFIVFITAMIWMYFRIEIRERFFTAYALGLMLINFALLTLIFYGNQRITGVVDFICLIFAFHTLFETFELSIL